MLSAVLSLTLNPVAQLADAALRRQATTTSGHPLAAYPALRRMISDAERTGMLAAERRRLMRRLAA